MEDHENKIRSEGKKEIIPPLDSYVPHITLENHAIDQENLRTNYLSAVKALYRYFTLSLDSHTVKEIAVLNGREDRGDDGIDTLGMWDDGKVILYPEAIASVKPKRRSPEPFDRYGLISVFHHELGHAFHQQQGGKDDYDDYNITASEAFAELAEVVMNVKGDVSAVSEVLGAYSDPRHLLFGAELSGSRYEDVLASAKIKDAALLHYLLQIKGTSQGLQTVIGLVNETPRFIRIDSIFDESIGKEMSKDKYDDEFVPIAQRYTRLTPAELAKEADNWYLAHSSLRSKRTGRVRKHLQNSFLRFTGRNHERTS